MPSGPSQRDPRAEFLGLPPPPAEIDSTASSESTLDCGLNIPGEFQDDCCWGQEGVLAGR